MSTSFPSPPTNTSSPNIPRIASLPAPPISWLAPASPEIASLPAPPITFSQADKLSCPLAEPTEVPAAKSIVRLSVELANEALSVPSPQDSASLPAPPARTSFPAPPTRALSCESPTIRSLPAPPLTFSMFSRASLPSPVANPVFRSTFRSLPVSNATVSVPAPPSMLSLPAPPQISLLPASPTSTSSNGEPITDPKPITVSEPSPVAVWISRFTLTALDESE